MIPPRLEPLLRADGPAVELARRFHEAGQELFLVGGSVRDALLDRPAPPDHDFATSAPPAVTKEIAGEWADDLYTMGETFGTIGVLKNGAVLEVTTYRSEIYRSESRKPEVTYSETIEEDLSRRDFTVNALALRLYPEPELVDPTGGLADLAEGRLRTPRDPHIAFEDDPLRMLRLFRFVATIGFEADPAAVEAAREMAERLDIVSAERIRDEFVRLLLGEGVSDALWGLVDTGLAERFVPELTALRLEQDPQHHHKDVLAHTIAVVAKTPPEEVLRLAALFHDIGKPDTREFTEDGVTFHHHEVVGARMTRSRMRALAFPKKTIEAVSQLVYLHMRPHTFKMGWTDKAVRRYVRDAGDLLRELNILVRCDVTTRSRKRAAAIQRRIDELEERIADLAEREELAAIRPPVDGNQVMEHLGLRPGPAVGEAMRMLLDHRLDHGPYDEEEAYRLLDAWAAERD